MSYFQVKVSPQGEMTLPESLRQRLHLQEGGTVLVREDDGSLVLDTIDSRVERAQALVRQYARPGTSVVDELIAERRAEALRE